MHILFTDETNMVPTDDARFFIYGGLMMPVERLRDLHRQVGRIRNDAGFNSTDVFKFNTHSKPEQVTREAHTEAKRRVLNVCRQLDCRFIAHVVHHGVIKNQDKDAGGIMAMDGEQFDGVPNHWMVYFAVDDCAAAAAKVAETGGTVCVPPTEIPVGTFSVLIDPQGCTFSVITLNEADC